MSSPPSEYRFSTPEGRNHARELLRELLPFDPHDYQLEGVTKSLDGVDLLAVLPTGGGKTGYLYMYMLIMKALNNDPTLCDPPKHVPKDPVMIAIYPTNVLEKEMESTFKKFGLDALVINQETTAEAALRGENLWNKALEHKGPLILLLSPEQLTTKGFESLIRANHFMARICAYAIDEFHLLNSWGKGFRKSFQQIGFVRARLRQGTVLIGTTATLLAGPSASNIYKFLGLREGHFYLLKRSNFRPEIQRLYRPLRTGLGGQSFPELRWISQEKRKTIIFAPTISLGLRIFVYLWHAILSQSRNPLTRMRLYNSLNPSSYNDESRDLFRNNLEMHILIATDCLMVGVDFPNVQDVVIVGEPAELDEEEQKKGRAARDRTVVPKGRGILYYTQNAMKTAHQIVKKAGNQKNKPSMGVSMARMLLAPCKTQEQNILYDNPISDTPCTCNTCQLHPPAPALSTCDCSGCMPEDDVDAPRMRRKTANPIPRKQRLTRKMRTVGTKTLVELRLTMHRSYTDGSRAFFLPPDVFLPDPTIKQILDRFALIQTQDDLAEMTRDNTYLNLHLARIWSCIVELASVFDSMRTKPARARTFGIDFGDDDEGMEMDDGDDDDRDDDDEDEGRTSRCEDEPPMIDATPDREPNAASSSLSSALPPPTVTSSFKAPSRNSADLQRGVVETAPGCFMGVFALDAGLAAQPKRTAEGTEEKHSKRRRKI
ncbi:hypothetical protein EIP86_011271 [Pleurotus ostreatoroseus]|nr:hypothetical protein EIP86_011271 [Pleurotus ostreatoroseus]